MTKTEATRRAAGLAAQISADNETAHGLALALETLTAAGDETPAGRYNAAARRAQADAVLQALADQLDRMQAAADQLEEITMQLAQPGRLSPADDQSGAALCAAICPHRMPPEQLDQISGAALPDQTGAGGAAQ